MQQPLAIPVLAFGLWMALPVPALANPDALSPHDARAAGMGRTTVAFLNTPAAIASNSATLELIDAWAVELSGFVLTVTATTPLEGDGTAVRSNPEVAPIGFIGGAGRVAPRVVLGAAVFVSSAGGASFTANFGFPDDPLPYEGSTVLGEFALAISVDLGGGFSLGLSPRFGYARQDLNAVAGSGREFLPLVAQVQIDGFMFGAAAGLLHRVNETWSWGVAYRSKMSATLTGTTVLGDEPLEGSGNWAVPHEFRAGVASRWVQDKLLLALDAKFQRFSETNQVLVLMAGELVLDVPQYWKDSFGFGIGAEYAVNTMVLVRGGFNLITSATPESTVNYLDTAPGLLPEGTVGLGLRFRIVALDLAVTLSWAHANVEGGLSYDGIYKGFVATYNLGLTFSLW